MIYLSGVGREGLGVMRTPTSGQTITPGEVWAADNGRYASPQTYDDEKYLAWLARRGPAGCLFATAPDTWGDAEETLALSVPMLPRIRALGFPTALVAQPVTTPDMVPWDLVDVIFLGGPDWWRTSQRCIDLVAEAKARGKWVHMGRVNSLRRMTYAESIGCDSADGTILKHDPSRPVETWAAAVNSAPTLWRPR